MSNSQTRPLPRLRFWIGVVSAVASLGNGGLWLYGLLRAPQDIRDVILWWIQLALFVLFGVLAGYQFWRSRADRDLLTATRETRHDAS